jgi:mannose-6-phosphate isomerase-like protein (cupin superfamily)
MSQQENFCLSVDGIKSITGTVEEPFMACNPLARVFRIFHNPISFQSFSSMANKAQTLSDTTKGDTIEFLETAKDSGGARTRFKVTVKPGGLKPVLHFHQRCDEHFKVLSGRLTYILDGRVMTLNEGEEVTLPKEKPHTHYNNEQIPLIMEQSFLPALDMEMFVENFFGLVGDGKVRNGQPDFLQIMVWLRGLESKTYVAALPKGVQDFLSALLAPIGRLLGYRVAYAKYNRFER